MKAEWGAYYNKINNDPEYSSDLFDDGDQTPMIIGDKLLILEMQSNGEFSVTNVYRSEVFAYNDGKEYKQFEDSWREDDYAEETLVNWLATFEEDARSEIPMRYDRVYKRFVPVGGRQASIRDGADGVYRRGTYREGILEVAAAELENLAG